MRSLRLNRTSHISRSPPSLPSALGLELGQLWRQTNCWCPSISPRGTSAPQPSAGHVMGSQAHSLSRWPSNRPHVPFHLHFLCTHTTSKADTCAEAKGHGRGSVRSSLQTGQAGFRLMLLMRQSRQNRCAPDRHVTGERQTSRHMTQWYGSLFS